MGTGDLREVQDFFWDFRAEWKMIGLELGIDIATLNSIEKSNVRVVEDCLREMLTQWLKRATPTPSRSAMAAVFKSKPLAGVSATAGELFHWHV